MISSPHIHEETHGKVMELELHGKLGREDANLFIHETEKMIREHGRIRILVTMHDFHGWKLNALWENIKWSTQHFNHIERVAVVGEKSCQDFMTAFYRPFTTAQVRYFTPDQIDAAHAWVNE